MLDKLNVVFQRYNEVNDLIIQPDIISDSKRYVKLNREYKNLKPLVDAREEYLELTSRIEEAKTVLKEEKDPDFRDMAKLELDELEPAFSELEEAIKILLIPKDPEDDKNAMVEIRAGTGGDEASIFISSSSGPCLAVNSSSSSRAISFISGSSLSSMIS